MNFDITLIVFIRLLRQWKITSLSINISIESINNIIFESLQHIQDQIKRADIPITIKYIYKNEENKTINESTITDRITYLTSTMF